MTERKIEAEGALRAPRLVGVVCPICHGRHLVEMGADLRPEDSLPFHEVRAGLEAWLASRCPDHLGAIAAMSKN